MIGELERQASEAERLAAEAAAVIAAETRACETPLMRAVRLSREAARARETADAARSAAWRRLLRLAFRLILAAFLAVLAYGLGRASGCA